MVLGECLIGDGITSGPARARADEFNAFVRDQAVRANPAPDPNQRLLGEGFRALQDGTLEVAEARFAQVLRAQPKNTEGLTIAQRKEIAEIEARRSVLEEKAAPDAEVK